MEGRSPHVLPPCLVNIHQEASIGDSLRDFIEGNIDGRLLICVDRPIPVRPKADVAHGHHAFDPVVRSLGVHARPNRRRKRRFGIFHGDELSDLQGDHQRSVNCVTLPTLGKPIASSQCCMAGASTAQVDSLNRREPAQRNKHMAHWSFWRKAKDKKQSGFTFWDAEVLNPSSCFCRLSVRLPSWVPSADHRFPFAMKHTSPKLAQKMIHARKSPKFAV